MIHPKANLNPMKSRFHSALKRRGSSYVLILSISMIITVIGLSSLLMAQIQRREIQVTADQSAARFYAVSAIDYALELIKLDPTGERIKFRDGTFPVNVPIGQGTMSFNVSDPVDGDPSNNTTDPLVIIGVGRMGDAVHFVSVRVNFVGGRAEFESGSWQRVVM